MVFAIVEGDSLNNSNMEIDLNAPSTSQQNTTNENNMYGDDNSLASSANSLQMSMLESKLESEITKMGKMMQDTISSLSEHMDQKLAEINSKFNNLVADITPKNSNDNSSITRTNQCNEATVTPTVACGSSSSTYHPHFKLKPQCFGGETDFDDFLSQFEITCEINGWQYREKSLYLANCLTGEARSLLSELDYDGRRDFDTLVEKLANRFGSVNRSEIFRTQLKSRVRNKGESIPELAQAVKKLVRQAYPGVNKDVIETLSIDHFIDALRDSEIRLRVREFGPKTLGDAERTALRLESHKIADRQRSRNVSQIETDNKHEKNDHHKGANDDFQTLQKSLDALTSYVKDLAKQTNKNQTKSMYSNGKQPGNRNSKKNVNFGRPYQNTHPRMYASQQSSVSQPSDNDQRGQGNELYPNQMVQGPSSGMNDHFRNRQNSDRNFANTNTRNGPSRFKNNQGNWNRSVWGATTRRQ